MEKQAYLCYTPYMFLLPHGFPRKIPESGRTDAAL